MVLEKTFLLCPLGPGPVNHVTTSTTTPPAFEREKVDKTPGWYYQSLQPTQVIKELTRITYICRRSTRYSGRPSYLPKESLHICTRGRGLSIMLPHPQCPRPLLKGNTVKQSSLQTHFTDTQLILKDTAGAWFSKTFCSTNKLYSRALAKSYWNLKYSRRVIQQPGNFGSTCMNISLDNMYYFLNL